MVNEIMPGVYQITPLPPNPNYEKEWAETERRIDEAYARYERTHGSRKD